MKSTHAMTAVAVAVLFAGFISPAAAQPANAQAQTDARASAQASSNVFGQIMSQLNSIQEQLTEIQNRLDSLEARIDANASAQAEARDSNGQQPDHAGRPEDAGNQGNGATVNHSVEVENGTKTISHEVTKNGETLVSFVKQIFVGDSGDAENGEETETEAELSIDVEGNVSQGENVTVRATHNGSAVANATVKINGEIVGVTDSNGEIVVTVESDEEFEVEAEKNELEGELEVEIKSETETEEEETEDSDTDDDSDSNTSAEAEADVFAEATVG